MTAKAWPYEEARKLIKRWPDGKPAKDGEPAPMLFETGYGPSGLPHIGTFVEVLRTTMVRHAYEELTGAPTRLIAFSDDMDGLRKVPDNIPGGEMLGQHLGKPLTQIPDPFGEYASFAHHNNAMLQRFLDQFGFDYEFVSSTDYYHAGRFDEALRQVLRHWDDILGVMLPTLGEERRRTYSPVLPLSPTSGRVLQVPVTVVDADAGMIAFTDEDGTPIEQSALGGQSKLQWKVDWAMRWAALGVDYEMSGKDLIDSTIQSGKICRILGSRPPEGFNYEMFLDEKGEKISKSKGNGLSLEQWLTYGSEESLAFYAYREPRKAKSLHIGVIPRAVDEYFQFRGNYAAQAIEQKLGNPVHHIHGGKVPDAALPVTFGLLLNLVGVLGPNATAFQVFRYLRKLSGEVESVSAQTTEQGMIAEEWQKLPAGDELSKLVDLALAYNRDFVAPTLNRRAPNATEREALIALQAALALLGENASSEEIQEAVYEIGKRVFGKENLRDWFRALYETLLGSSQGPRMGSFIALYGVGNSGKLIAEALTAA